MITFAKRRLIGCSALFVALIILFLLNRMWQNNLVSTSIQTGLLLITLIFALIGLNIRKRFSFLPVGRAATWLQVHLYMGWFTIAVFATHISFRVPKGGLESVLAAIFMTVVVSGILGLILTRLIPRYLTDRGGNIAFQEIPKIRRRIKNEAEDLVVQSIEQSKMSTIADYYVDRLEAFFIGSNTALINHLVGSSKHLEPVLSRMEALRRYLNEDEMKIINRLEELVIEKDNVDYQYSWLFLLKTWLFIHVPLSYALLVVGVVHGVIAYRFYGS